MGDTRHGRHHGDDAQWARFLEQVPASRAGWLAWLSGAEFARDTGTAGSDDAALLECLRFLAAGYPRRATAAAERIDASGPLGFLRAILGHYASWYAGASTDLHELYELAISMDEASAPPEELCVAWYFAGRAHARAGAPDTASIALDRAAGLATVCGATDLALLARADLIAARADDSDADERLQAASIVRAAAARLGWRRIQIRTSAGAAMLLERLGRRADARLRAEGALLHARALAPDEDRAMACALVARLRMESGDHVGAAAALGRADDWIPRAGAPTWAWRVVRAGLQLSALGSDGARADEWHRLARRLHHAGRLPWDALRLEGDACLAHAHGAHDEARRLGTRAAGLWRIAGMADETAFVDTLENVAGNPFEHHAQLTPRERQVAQLAASRMTNSEIADTLQVSIRTAEHHVAAVLRKLELRSRYELPQLVGDDR